MATEDPILELITSAIPVADDGCCMIEVRSDGTSLWGHPSTLAALIRDKITESGRLLPSGGEVRTEWAIDHHRLGILVVGMGEGGEILARAAADRGDGPLVSRQVVTWGEIGLNTPTYIGPWSPVVSDNSEVPDAD